MTHDTLTAATAWQAYLAITVFAVGLLLLAHAAPWFATATLAVLGACGIKVLHGYCRIMEHTVNQASAAQQPTDS